MSRNERSPSPSRGAGRLRRAMDAARSFASSPTQQELDQMTIREPDVRREPLHAKLKDAESRYVSEETSPPKSAEEARESAARRPSSEAKQTPGMKYRQALATRLHKLQQEYEKLSRGTPKQRREAEESNLKERVERLRDAYFAAVQETDPIKMDNLGTAEIERLVDSLSLGAPFDMEEIRKIRATSPLTVNIPEMSTRLNSTKSPVLLVLTPPPLSSRYSPDSASTSPIHEHKPEFSESIPPVESTDTPTASSPTGFRIRMTASPVIGASANESPSHHNQSNEQQTQQQQQQHDSSEHSTQRQASVSPLRGPKSAADLELFNAEHGFVPIKTSTVAANRTSSVSGARRTSTVDAGVHSAADSRRQSTVDAPVAGRRSSAATDGPLTAATVIKEAVSILGTGGVRGRFGSAPASTSPTDFSIPLTPALAPSGTMLPPIHMQRSPSALDSRDHHHHVSVQQQLPPRSASCVPVLRPAAVKAVGAVNVSRRQSVQLQESAAAAAVKGEDTVVNPPNSGRRSSAPQVAKDSPATQATVQRRKSLWSGGGKTQVGSSVPKTRVYHPAHGRIYDVLKMRPVTDSERKKLVEEGQNGNESVVYLVQDPKLESVMPLFGSMVEPIVWTGLYDTSNTHVYDGDIVKMQDAIYVMKFALAGWKMVAQNGREQSVSAHSRVPGVVVGNKFEHPHLLSRSLR